MTKVLPNKLFFFADTYFILVNSSGIQVAYNAQAETVPGDCYPGSQISYMIPYTAGCQNYTLREGCYDANPCSGTTGVFVQEFSGPTQGNFFSSFFMSHVFMNTVR